MAASERAALSSALQQAWLRQLRREYEALCFQYRLELAPPFLVLSDSRTRLGYWNAATRELGLSIHLIRQQDWTVTCQVLKHEMAHQICTDLFQGDHAGHGPAFQRAASLLGLEEHFCRAGIDCSGLDGLMSASGGENGSRARILTRIEKLFALAGSDNEHEAALAMERAWQLLRRHNIDLANQRPEYRRRILSTGRRRMPAHLKQICALLQDFFFVQVIGATTYLPAEDREVRTVELFGRPANVDVAAHCFHFLVDRTEHLWQENRHCFGPESRRARKGYLCGLVAGFRERLAGAEHASQPGRDCSRQLPACLVPARDAALRAFVARYHPRLVRRSEKMMRLHGRAYAAARTEGRKIVLHRVLHEVHKRSALLAG